jgi:hypothetical protein
MNEKQMPTSPDTPTPPAAGNQAGGCLRYALITLAVVVLGGMILVGGALWGAKRAVEQGVMQPMAALVRQLGINTTPVIRPNAVTIVRSINDLAQLTTASYTVEKIINAQSGSAEWFGLFEDNLLFVAVGQVTAGVDLAELTQADIQAESFDRATIYIPPARVFMATLDNERSYVAHRSTGLLRRADSQMETQARRAAEAEILEAAQAQGILEIADRNARQVLEGLLLGLGFREVVFSDRPMPPVTPASTQPPKGFLLTPVP